MAAATQPLDVLKGESRTFRVTARDDDNEIVDVSGATLIEFEVQEAVEESDTPDISKSLGSGIEFVTDGTDGEFDITLLPGDTDTLPPKTYKYDVVVVIGGKRSYVIRPSDFELNGVVNPNP